MEPSLTRKCFLRQLMNCQEITNVHPSKFTLHSLSISRVYVQGYIRQRTSTELLLDDGTAVFSIDINAFQARNQTPSRNEYPVGTYIILIGSIHAKKREQEQDGNIILHAHQIIPLTYAGPSIELYWMWEVIEYWQYIKRDRRLAIQ